MTPAGTRAACSISRLSRRPGHGGWTSPPARGGPSGSRSPARPRPRSGRSPAPHVLPANCCSMPWRTRCWAVAPCPVSRLRRWPAASPRWQQPWRRPGRCLPGSPAAARLARLCQRRAIEVRGALADQGRRVDLPGPWASVLDHDPRQEGRLGVLPAAAVLPEIDGARFVLAGLVSGEREAIMSVFAWGWESRPRAFRPGQPFSWWARDNAGRWHVGRWPPYDMVAGTFHLEFYPPLDPAATVPGHHPHRPVQPGDGDLAAGLAATAGGIRRSRYIVLTDEMTGSAARRLVARAGTPVGRAGRHTGRRWA